MGATHLPSIVINIALAAVVGQAQGFSSVMLIVPLADNTLDGAEFITYTSAADATADETSGFISTTTLDAVRVAFSQNPAPAEFLVGAVDLVGAEAYDEAAQRLDNAGAGFYGTCIESRLAADLVLMSNWAEAAEAKLFVGSSDDASIKTSTLDPSLSALEGKEQTVMEFYDRPVGPSAWPDVSHAVNRLVANPDSTSSPWNTPVQATQQLLAGLTDAERIFILGNNFNVGLPFASSSDFYIYQGLNMAGRQAHEIVSADWFQARLQEGTSALIARLSSLQQKLPISVGGQAQVLSIVNALFSQGVTAEHFAEGETEAYGKTITQADRDSFKMRFAGRAQLLGSATDLELDFNFSNQPLT